MFADTAILQQLIVEEAEIYMKKKEFNNASKVIHQVQVEFPSVAAETSLAKSRIYQALGKKQQAMMIYNQLLAKNSSQIIFSQAVALAAINCMR